MYKKIILLIFIVLSTTKSYAKTIEDFEHKAAIPIDDFQFIDGNKNIHSLNDYKGKVVLVNFWATWCKPCVKEMPALSKLKKMLSGFNVELLPISIDYKGIKVVDEFYKEHKIKNLKTYLDKKGSSFKKLKLMALPTTLIINKDGDEVARILGEIDWTNKKVKKYLIKLSGD